VTGEQGNPGYLRGRAEAPPRSLIAAVRMGRMRHYYHIAGLLLGLAFTAFAELTITGLDADSVTWTNSVSNATCRVTMASTVTSSWDAITLVTNMTTANITQTNAAAFFRVEWINPPDVVRTNLEDHVFWMSSMPIDLNGDGATDVTLRHENFVTPDGSSYSDFIYAKAYCVCLTPFPTGRPIRMDVTPDSWVDASQYGGKILGERKSLLGPWAYGPWAGVTNANLPVQFVSSNAIYLGWVNMTPSTNGTLWDVHSGAYRPAPETMLNAGE